MTDTTRIAVIGAAGWAGSRHVKAFHALGARVVALIDPSPHVCTAARAVGAEVLDHQPDSTRTRSIWSSWHCQAGCNRTCPQICCDADCASSWRSRLAHPVPMRPPWARLRMSKVP